MSFYIYQLVQPQILLNTLNSLIHLLMYSLFATFILQRALIIELAWQNELRDPHRPQTLSYRTKKTRIKHRLFETIRVYFILKNEKLV